MNHGLFYKTDRLYPIRIEEPADDGLTHWAWVKNTTQGPCFYAMCDGPRTESGFRGALNRAFGMPNCLGCLAVVDQNMNPVWGT